MGVIPSVVSGIGGALGIGGSGAPSAPDFTTAAQRQAQASGQAVGAQTLANRPNQVNAFGTTTNWTQGPNGQWTQTQSLGGPLAGAASSLEGQVAQSAASPLDNGTSVRDQAINATYGQMASRLDPIFAQREESERARLANQGLDPGTEGYNNQWGNFERARNDAYTSALNSAVTNANQAQALTFGENLAAKQLPYQQLGALGGFTGQPSFLGAGLAQTPNYLGAAEAQYGGAKDKFSADQAAKNGLLSGVSGLGGAMGGKGGAAPSAAQFASVAI